MGHRTVVMCNVILKQLKYIFTFSHNPLKLKIISIVVTVYKADVCNCSEPFTVISKTCEVGHPCKLATYHSWPHLQGAGKILITLYMLLLHTVATCLSWILATVSYLVLCFLYKFSLPMLADPNSSLVFLSQCTRAKILIH